jgi:uncharacterized protein
MTIYTVETDKFKNRVFLDTSYAIALSARSDVNHQRAVELARQLETEATRFVTTRAIMLEIGNALAKARYRKAAVRLLNALENDPKVEIIPASEDLFRRALKIYEGRLDKEWGLIDCMSFVVMSDEKLADALTADDHFRQAGFRVLL